ncbi:MAG: 5-formyltetrahydrofolate cyclo-ligase [Bdellovibrionota bacterium]|nr:5-formyltetrahydrofolate cyclo-ligase [Bdellovibrionota bacterium]
MGINDEKIALRREIKKRLKDISQREKKKKSSLICGELFNLLNSLKLSPNFTLGVYAPLKEEVDIGLEPLKGYVQRWAFPDIDQEMMIFRQCHFEDLKESEDFGVRLLTPPKEAPLVNPDILLIPGLAFNDKGQRLGRGKGFYDRFLENYQGATIGVCFSEQIEESIPVDDHDVLVDYVVSESGNLRN